LDVRRTANRATLGQALRAPEDRCLTFDRRSAELSSGWGLRKRILNVTGDLGAAREVEMNGRRRLAAVSLAPAVALALASGAGQSAEAPRRCCFANERYAGVCEVVPEQDATCADILAYLNNPNATGKTYCGTTDIRGGWVQVCCAEEAPAPSRKASDRSAPIAAAKLADRRPPARPR
jgi:hypothetical protein